MKAVACLCLGVSLLAAPARAWQAAPVGTLTAVPVQSSSSPSASRAPAAPCSAVAIRQAAARKVAPPLTGCAYDAVVPYIQQFYRITPVGAETAGRRAKGTILTQQPAAGAGLATGGTLRLSVSTGVPAPAASSSSSSVVKPNTTVPGAAAPVPQASSSSSSRVEPRPVAPQPKPEVVSDRPDEPAVQVPVAPEPVASAAVVDMPAPVVEPEGRGGWVFPLVVVVLLAAAGGTAYHFRNRLLPKAAPDVRCDLDFGEGRLIVDGPLIEGPAVEVRATAELGTLIFREDEA